ncbi:hypothetical protein C7271_19030 [filamentous cyanobacterium CCP5]|nr:hypothetical protein C7271_19030 [filamentous cyanobacterium CCP5]
MLEWPISVQLTGQLGAQLVTIRPPSAVLSVAVGWEFALEGCPGGSPWERKLAQKINDCIDWKIPESAKIQNYPIKEK